MHSFLKIRDRVKHIATPYYSICADNDVVLLPGVRAIRRGPAVGETRERRPRIYFNFADNAFFEPVYRTRILAAQKDHFVGYLEPFLRADVMQVIFSDHVWKAFVRRRPRLSLRVPLTGPGRIAHALERIASGGIPTDYVATGGARAGRHRTYRIFHGLLALVGGAWRYAVDRHALRAMLTWLDAY